MDSETTRERLRKNKREVRKEKYEGDEHSEQKAEDQLGKGNTPEAHQTQTGDCEEREQFASL